MGYVIAFVQKALMSECGKLFEKIREKDHFYTCFSFFVPKEALLYSFVFSLICQKWKTLVEKTNFVE